MADTANCIVCGNQATKWTGHVHVRKNMQATAGWCDRCFALAQCAEGFEVRDRKPRMVKPHGRSRTLIPCLGCHGDWWERDGITRTHGDKEDEHAD